ncbi:serine/threonine protein kinase, partial [bacterium]|nr:serine/threonine protein kinase [bacterium]
MEDALGAREEPAAAHSMIGVALGSYRLTRPLGRGGMGVVYEADDLSLGRKVAIKLLPRSACGDAQALARFRLEARAAARLNHPNVVSIYDVKEDEGRGYIVMELALGPSADELARARGGRLPWREAAGIVAAACRGLAAAHAAGLIHRDLKPSNVICPEGGSAKLAD